MFTYFEYKFTHFKYNSNYFKYKSYYFKYKSKCFKLKVKRCTCHPVLHIKHQCIYNTMYNKTNRLTLSFTLQSLQLG